MAAAFNGGSAPWGGIPAVEKPGAFVGDDFMYGTSAAHCSAEIRNGFLRKVYGLLSAQLLATTLLSCVFMFHTPTRLFVTRTPALLLVSLAASFGFLFATHAWKAVHPTNLLCLGGFTLSLGYSVAVTCASFQANGAGALVLEAFVLTAAIAVGLTAYTLQSRRDFSFMGAGLSAGLSLLVLGSLLNWLVALVTGAVLFSGAFGFAVALAGAVLFAGFIVYDTWLIANKLGPDQYIEATLMLYLDIVNLFLELLRILQHLNGNGRD